MSPAQQVVKDASVPVRESGLRIRPALVGDEADLYTICRLTGNAGADATRLLRHPELLGDIYAVPYLGLAPQFCFVVEDSVGVCAYVLGAPDTKTFNAQFASLYLPRLRAKYPLDEGDTRWDAGYLRNCIHTEPAPLAAVLSAYPAHLHIDILPRAQGKGLGRTLMETLFAAFRAKGVPGVHLGVDARNVGAIAFYQRLGMQELLREDWGIVFGQPLL